MTDDVHVRAQRLTTAARVEGIAASEQAWLVEHLEGCAACAQFAAHTQRAIEALRWVVVSADPALVEATRLRVRLRAGELDEHEARLLPVAASCVLAVLLSLASLSYLWQGFAWLGGQWGLPAPAWQAGVLWTWFLPAALIAAVMLWLRPPAFNGSGRAMEWSPASRGPLGGER